MTTDQKKERVRELLLHIQKAWIITNRLMKEEPHSHTKTGEIIYDLRKQLEWAELTTKLIKYKDEPVKR